MTAPTPLTPRMAELLTRIQRANRPPFHSLTPREARLAYRMGAEILDLPRAPLARGVTHDFIKMGRSLPEAVTALDFCATAIREHLNP